MLLCVEWDGTLNSTIPYHTIVLLPWELLPLSECVKVKQWVVAVTSHLGDRQVGDKPTGWQPTWRYILVNWATEVETTGPQLWKCERLTIAVLQQSCAVLGQKPSNITHQTNLPHSSLECCEVAGLIDALQCSVNQTAQVVSQPLSDFVSTLIAILCRRPLITACYGEVVLQYVGEGVLLKHTGSV